MAIPFIDNEDGYQKMIEKIMELERSRLVRMETNVSQNNLRREGLREIREQFTLVSNYSRELYGLNSVFRNNRADSDNEEAVEAIVENPNITSEKHNVVVKQLATSQVIASNPVKKTLKLPASEMVFRVDETEIPFSFKGGTLEKFALALAKNNEVSKAIKVRLVRKNSRHSILMLASRKEGEKNRIRLKKDSNSILTLKLKMFEYNKQIRTPLFNLEVAQTLAPTNAEQTAQNEIALAHSQKISLDVDSDISFSSISHIGFSYRIKKEKKQNTGKTQKNAVETAPADREGKSKEQGINLGEKQRNTAKAPAITSNIPGEKPLSEREKKQVIATVSYRKHLVSDRKKADTDRNGSAGTAGYTLPLLKKQVTLGDAIFGTVVLNDFWFDADENEIVSIENITITNPQKKIAITGIPEIVGKRKNKDRLKPVNEVTEAKNAILSYENIEVERESNTVNDLVEGIVLKLKKPTQKPVSLSVQIDSKSIYDRIIRFFQEYNRGIEMINVSIAPDEESLQAQNFPEELKDRIGIFNGDYNLFLFKEKIRDLITKPYNAKTVNDASISAGDIPLQLLVQIGVKRLFSLQSPFDIDNDKVDIDLEKLQAMLASRGSEMSSLFGNDSDGNVLIDNGMAYELSETIRTNFQEGSYFALLDLRINEENRLLAKDIDAETKRLEEREEKLTGDFSKVEAAMQEQESISKYLEQFGNNR